MTMHSGLIWNLVSAALAGMAPVLLPIGPLLARPPVAAEAQRLATQSPPRPVSRSTKSIAADGNRAAEWVPAVQLSSQETSDRADGQPAQDQATVDNRRGVADADVPVDSYGEGRTNGVASLRNLYEGERPLSGKERYGYWSGLHSIGTGDGSVIGTSFGLGAVAIKRNFESTVVPGQFAGVNVVVRGGYHGKPQPNVVALQGYDASGDVAGILGNVVSSNQRNYAAFSEAVVYSTQKGVFDSSIFGIKVQSGAMQPGAGQNGIGFFTEALNGRLGAAFAASNRKTDVTYGIPGEWANFLLLTRDTGRRVYTPFRVDGAGIVTLTGSGAMTPSKSLSVTESGDLQITNNAGAPIAKLRDDGALSTRSVKSEIIDTASLTLGSNAPLSSSGACSKGSVQWDEDYVYICIRSNTWKRARLTGW